MLVDFRGDGYSNGWLTWSCACPLPQVTGCALGWVPTHHPTTAPLPPTQHIPAHHSTPTPQPPPQLAPMPCKGMDTQNIRRVPKWGCGMVGHMIRSPQGTLSAGKDRRKVVMCPRRGSHPASGYPGIQEPASGEGSPTTAGMGYPLGHTSPTARAVALLCVVLTQSCETGTLQGSVDTTYQGKGMVSKEIRIGQVGRGRAQGGERLMGAATYGGKGLGERAKVSGLRPICATSSRQQHNHASCQPPPSSCTGHRVRFGLGLGTPPLF